MIMVSVVEAGTIQEKLIASLPNESSVTAASKWVVWKKKFGTETVQINFPKKPSVQSEDGILFVSTVLNNVEYSLITAYPPACDIDLMLFIQEFGDEIREYEIYEKDGDQVMDFVADDFECGTVARGRVVVTDHNFYMFGTECIEGTTNKHDTFVNSFKLSK